MSSLTADCRVCSVPAPPRITTGLDAMVDAMIGVCRRRRVMVSVLQRDAERVDGLGDAFRPLSDAALKGRLDDFRMVFRRQRRDADAHLLEALAAVREAAGRQTGMRPFVVQLMGALALRRGLLAEMATGEGKTLTAGMAAVLAGWSGRPCHVVTANDYLAQRDAEWMGKLYAFCGVSVGCITGPMQSADRVRGYGADVTYTTSKEIVADFLRDRLCLGGMQTPARRLIRQFAGASPAAGRGVVMRGLHTAIVDEADSVLIDEAVTPLIISGATGADGVCEAYQAAGALAGQLAPGLDYRCDARYREIALLPAAGKKLEALEAGLPAMWRAPSRRAELIEQALTARELFHRDRQYVVQDGRVVIVDEFTGRLMPMRKWRHGLHQAIEVKEGLAVSPLDETLARLSFQRFFRLFPRLSGMTGTAREAAAEFWHIYRLPVAPIPTNRPCVRRELPDRVFASQRLKWAGVVEEIARLHAAGRPVLVGTRTIAASERLAEKLRALGLEFSLLNATRHPEEAQIVAGAGQRGRITIATNMAGRGTDIKLGAGVAELGGLHVLATERHEAGRIDRQLYGRSGRQGDPGSAQAFVSAEDELLERFLPKAAARRLARSLGEGAARSARLAGAAFRFAQWAAQRQAFQQRRQVLKQDVWLDEALSFAGPGRP